jgi:hypothetical protein
MVNIFDLKQRQNRQIASIALLSGALVHLLWSMDAVREFALFELGPINIQMVIGGFGVVYGVLMLRKP